MSECTQWIFAEDAEGDYPDIVDASFVLSDYYTGESIGYYVIPRGGLSLTLDSSIKYKFLPLLDTTDEDDWINPDEVSQYGCAKDLTFVWKKIICDPGDQKCKGDDVYRCSNDGTEWKYIKNCPAGCDDGECLEVLEVPPEITAIGTEDTPKICEPVQFSANVDWNDDDWTSSSDGTGTQQVWWGYSRDDAEWDSECADELSWVQFSSDTLFPLHTFIEEHADIKHIRCIVENKYGLRGCAIIDHFSLETTDGFIITIDPSLDGKKMIVYHVTPIIGTSLYYFPFSYVGGEWEDINSDKVYKVPVGNIASEPSPEFDSTFNTGSFAEGIDCVILVESSDMIGFSIFEGKDVFRLNSEPICVSIGETSNDVITESVMGPVCDFFGIPRGTECESFWAEFYDPVFIANYISIMETGKDTLGNERELSAIDHIALPFAIIGSIPGLSLLPFGAFISNGLEALSKNGARFGDEAIEFMLEFSMDTVGEITDKDTWYFLDAIGQVTEEHATEIVAALTSGKIDEAETLLKQYAGESKGWWDYHTLNDLLKDALPEDTYKWLRTQIGLPEIGTGTFINTAKKATLTADDVAIIADAAADSEILDKAVDWMYYSVKNLDVEDLDKLSDLQNVLKNSPEVAAKLITKHTDLLDGVVTGGAITSDEIVTLLNHAHVDPEGIAGMVTSLDNSETIIETLTDGTKNQALGNFIDTTKQHWDLLYGQVGSESAGTWVKNNAELSRKALDSVDPAGMADIPHAAQEIAAKQGDIVDAVCSGGTSTCIDETNDLIFGGGRNVVDEIIDVTDEFVDESTDNWLSKGKSYIKNRYDTTWTWYNALSEANKENAVHAMMAGSLFFIVTVIYAIYKLTDEDDFSPAYGLKSQIMEESYWVCENACDEKLYDELDSALTIFRKDVTSAEEWIEENTEALEGEETFEEFRRNVELRRIQIALFEVCLDEGIDTGYVKITSNEDFFYVDLDGSPAGYSYNTKEVLLGGIRTGDHTIKVHKHGFTPECTEGVRVTEGDTKTVDCQMLEEGTCYDVLDVEIYIDPSSPMEDETVAFNGSADSNDKILDDGWTWDFGDGATETGQSVTHSFDSAGKYMVELIVTNECGESASATQIISVEEEPESTSLSIQTPIDEDGNDLDYYWEVEIWVDGKITGCNPPHTLTFGTDAHCDCIDPWNLVECELGTHEITMKKDGYEDVSKTFNLKADSPQTWKSPTMVKTGTGFVKCKSTPTGANISIDDVYYGDTDMTIELPAGSAWIIFKKDGYEDCDIPVTVLKDETVTAECVMEAGEMHDISIMIPDGATLEIDGEEVKGTTISKLYAMMRVLRR